ncbi:DUF1353 domain-containing protein [Asticcacaulis sp. YBE204]|uniref:DUF1353 domain-containing protein n=1 Tax=Asticcacaulis sp. YBE204 TaxID=1282363 RepID=UPI0003C3F84F|nr:DUF1353 domain-containing protein [Asticcacaulis sp. YBE204]ESQ80481.1 hypothetical protein AEYBE204_04230 [Asticcacaulis sp. YBE204]
MLKTSLKAFVCVSVLTLTGCATDGPTPTPLPVVIPSSLTPQPVLMFDVQKEGRKLYTLNDEFPYCDRTSGKVIVVPKWFQTDFASVPWYGQMAVNTNGPTIRAAIIHDWLYAIGEPGKRKDADDIFYYAMRKWGVSEIEARIAYNAVRQGGERGYGLASDWVFINPAQPGVRLAAPFPKPKTGVVMVLPQCKGFEEMIAKGWKAYAPKPVIVEQPKKKPLFGIG